VRPQHAVMYAGDPRGAALARIFALTAPRPLAESPPPKEVSPMTRSSLSVVFGSLFSIALGITPVLAGTYSTSALQGASSGTMVCTVSNVGTTAATVTVTFIDGLGNGFATTSDHCGALAAGATCFATVLPNNFVRCVVDSSSSKIRAALQFFDSTGATIVSVPATKK